MSRVGTLIAAAIGSVVLLAVGVGLYLPGFNDGGRLTQGQALIELASHVRQIKPRDAFVTYRANVPLSASSSLEASLPDIDRFPLNVNPPANTGDVVAEFFSSAEKAGKDTDGWLAGWWRSRRGSTSATSSLPADAPPRSAISPRVPLFSS